MIKYNGRLYKTLLQCSIDLKAVFDEDRLVDCIIDPIGNYFGYRLFLLSSPKHSVAGPLYKDSEDFIIRFEYYVDYDILRVMVVRKGCPAAIYLKVYKQALTSLYV